MVTHSERYGLKVITHLRRRVLLELLRGEVAVRERVLLRCRIRASQTAATAALNSSKLR
jgi:hypothetical protein